MNLLHLKFTRNCTNGKNAPGFSDIIWGGWQWGQGSGVSTRSRTTAFERELNRVGFKALADADSILQRIESWRKAQVSEQAEKGWVFIKSKGQPATAEEAQPVATKAAQPDTGREIANTTMFFTMVSGNFMLSPPGQGMHQQRVNFAKRLYPL